VLSLREGSVRHCEIQCVMGKCLTDWRDAWKGVAEFGDGFVGLSFKKCPRAFVRESIGSLEFFF
jgi:hypothetical protein